jgi:hypothetical protein
MVANLVTEQSPETLLMPTQDYLSGTTVSSLHRLRDLDNSGKFLLLFFFFFFFFFFKKKNY